MFLLNIFSNQKTKQIENIKNYYNVIGDKGRVQLDLKKAMHNPDFINTIKKLKKVNLYENSRN